MTTYSFPERMANDVSCRDMLNKMTEPLRLAVKDAEQKNPLPIGWKYDLSIIDEIGPESESIIIAATLKPVRIEPPEGNL